MRKQVFIMLLLPLSLLAQERRAITLADCYKAAREFHPSYSDQGRIGQISDLKVSNVKTQWLPQLNLSGQATYQSASLELSTLVPATFGPQGQVTSFAQKTIKTDKDQYKGTLDVNQVLYDGGSVSVQKQMAVESGKSDMLQTEVDIQKVKEQVNQVYFTLLILKQSQQQLQATQNNLLEKRKSLESGLTNGLLTANDLRQIDVELVKIAQQITELEISYSSNLQVLAEITGLKIESGSEVSLPEELITMYDSIVRPEQKLFASQRTNLDLSKKLSQTQRMPKLYAFGQVGYGKPGLNMISNDFSTFGIVGLTFKWNIWDWSKTAHDKQIITLQQEMIASKEEQFVRSIRIAKDNNHAKISQLEKAIEADTKIVSLNNEIVQTNSIRLDQGIITTTDYINSVNAELIAKIQSYAHKVQLIQAKYDYITLLGY